MVGIQFDDCDLVETRQRRETERGDNVAIRPQDLRVTRIIASSITPGSRRKPRMVVLGIANSYRRSLADICALTESCSR